MSDARPVSYGGFLSYSHAADGLLAPKLQSALQRFAKPWWKRRTLRMFRDETSLSANPHLWSSITEALDDSDWFVLLLSPDAAQSEWVNKEIDYWTEHKDPHRILPVLTDGEFVWSGGDVTGDAVPESLHGVFGDEPRWVDLRFARTETQLDLRHARFRDAVADIAAAIRGVAKDELESEEIRQHRRTIRTAWTGGVVILTLGAAATVGAVVAVNQSNEAQTQRDEAQQERDRAVAAEQTSTEERDRANLLAEQEAAARTEAEQQRTLAEQESDRAEDNAAEAVRAARESRARELAAAALLNLDSNPERSILLALESVMAAAGSGRVLTEPVEALRRSVAASRIVLRVPGGELVAYSSDGSLLATDVSRGDVAIWDAETGQQLRILSSRERRPASRAAFLPDGDYLAVSYLSEEGQGGPLVVIWDVSTGEEVMAFESDGFDEAYPVTFSPDGSLVAVQASGGTAIATIVWNVASRAEHLRIEYADGHGAFWPSFSPDGRLIAVADYAPDLASRVVIHDAETGAEVDDFDLEGFAPVDVAFDPTGSLLAAVSQIPNGVFIWDLATRERISIEPEQFPASLEWSPDGTLLAVSGNQGVPRLYDGETGELVQSLLGHDTLVWDMAFSPSGERLAAVGIDDGPVLVWDISPSGSREVLTLSTPYDSLFGAWYDKRNDDFILMSEEDADSTIARIDASTGDLIATLGGQSGVWPTNARVFPVPGIVASLNAAGEAELLDLADFELIAEVPAGQFVMGMSDDGSLALLNPLNEASDPVFARVPSWETITTFDGLGQLLYAFFSPDGNLATIWGGTGDVTGLLVDTATGSVLATFEIPYIPGYFSPDSSQLALGSLTGTVRILDVDALRHGEPIDDAIIVDIDAHDGAAPVIEFSPDGSTIATRGFINERLRLWELPSGRLIGQLPGAGEGFPSYFFHPNGDHFVLEGENGTIRILTLDTNELLDIARTRITRGFTEDECFTYHIDPCPDLATIRGG